MQGVGRVTETLFAHSEKIFIHARQRIVERTLGGGAALSEKAAISGACLGWCASSVTAVQGEKFCSSRREVTGWPKDKHSLSTAQKVFSCK